MSGTWPVTQIRFARPTSQLEAVVRFYRDGLGLAVLGTFSGHAGYSGVMLGLPGTDVHLEFTEHERGSPCPAPTRDNLLVLYIPDARALAALVARMQGAGYSPVAPENPYWLARGTTFEDPDGWRVVLMNTPGLTAD
jgi:catechol 2,3-dioxygenase-like lactoylglutathione lyase family enzyme